MNERTSRDITVITGAGGGLAPSVAGAFATAGHQLVLVTRPGKESGAEQLAETVNAAKVLGVDLGDAEGVTAAFESLTGEFGPIRGLLNLAGGFASDTEAADRSLLSRMLEINLFTAHNATAAVLPAMLAAGEGFIAAVSANAATVPSAGSAHYAASKGALAAYFRSLAAKVGKEGVSVSLVTPTTAIDTPGNREAMPKTDPAKWIDPAAVAGALLYLTTTRARGRVRELALYP